MLLKGLPLSQNVCLKGRELRRAIAHKQNLRCPFGGIRRRGVTSVALRAFAYNIGITKFNGLTDVAVLEHAIREDLNKRALRRLAVLRPIKVVIANFPEGKVEELDAVNNPEKDNPDLPQAPKSAQPLYYLALLLPREVGRAKLPSNTIGLIFHAAEHSSRHAGQVVTLARVV